MINSNIPKQIPNIALVNHGIGINPINNFIDENQYYMFLKNNSNYLYNLQYAANPLYISSNNNISNKVADDIYSNNSNKISKKDDNETIGSNTTLKTNQNLYSQPIVQNNYINNFSFYPMNSVYQPFDNKINNIQAANFNCNINAENNNNKESSNLLRDINGSKSAKKLNFNILKGNNIDPLDNKRDISNNKSTKNITNKLMLKNKSNLDNNNVYKNKFDLNYVVNQIDDKSLNNENEKYPSNHKENIFNINSNEYIPQNYLIKNGKINNLPEKGKLQNEELEYDSNTSNVIDNDDIEEKVANINLNQKNSVLNNSELNTNKNFSNINQNNYKKSIINMDEYNNLQKRIERISFNDSQSFNQDLMNNDFAKYVYNYKFSINDREDLNNFINQNVNNEKSNSITNNILVDTNNTSNNNINNNTSKQNKNYDLNFNFSPSLISIKAEFNDLRKDTVDKLGELKEVEENDLSADITSVNKKCLQDNENEDPIMSPNFNYNAYYNNLFGGKLSGNTNNEDED